MALIMRTASSMSRRSLYTSVSVFGDKMMPEPVEHATGVDHREARAHAAGDDNPFDLKVFKRTAGTKDKPTVLPSFYDTRLVGCICDEDQTHINWMWLKKGVNKRCECGYWFQLDEARPF